MYANSSQRRLYSGYLMTGTGIHDHVVSTFYTFKAVLTVAAVNICRH